MNISNDEPVEGDGFVSYPDGFSMNSAKTTTLPRYARRRLRKQSAVAPQDIRKELWERMPMWSQWIWTWLTGKAMPGQKPLVTHTAASQTLIAVVQLFLLPLINVVSLNLVFSLVPRVASNAVALIAEVALVGPVVLLWLGTVNAIRVIQTTVIHQLSHRSDPKYKPKDAEDCTGFGTGEENSAVARVLSALILAFSFKIYVVVHKTHHGKMLATVFDPDFVFMAQFGIEAGKSMGQLWWALAKTCVSPIYHSKYLVSRMRDNFGTDDNNRTVAIYLHGGLLVTAVAASLFVSSLTPLLLYVFAWLFPLLVLHPIAVWGQLVTEHQWCIERNPDEPFQMQLRMLTVNRFLGSPLPDKNEEGIQYLLMWAGWWCKMLGHLAARLTICTGDLPVHPYHHEFARGDWPNAPYAYASSLAKGSAPHAEHWGSLAWFNGVFAIMSKLHPSANLPALTKAEEHEVMATM